MKFFVVEYERRSQAVSVAEFVTSEEALLYLRNREAMRGPTLEVVFFMARDLDSLKATHSRFFSAAQEITAPLANAATPVERSFSRMAPRGSPGSHVPYARNVMKYAKGVSGIAKLYATTRTSSEPRTQAAAQASGAMLIVRRGDLSGMVA